MERDDELERLNRMMNEEEEEWGPFLNLSVTGVDFVAMPDARNRGNMDILQWKPFLKKYRFLPYANPETEFLENEHTLSLRTLLYRWAGLNKETEIYRFYYHPATLGKRFIAQQKRRAEMALPDAEDKENIRVNNAVQVQYALERIEYLRWLLVNNVAPTTESYFIFAQGGTVIREEMRTLSQTARSKADKDLREWIETYRMLTGQAMKNVKVDNTHELAGGKSIREMIVEAMVQHEVRTPEGFTLQQLQNGESLALQSGEDVIEGEVTYGAPEEDINYDAGTDGGFS